MSAMPILEQAPRIAFLRSLAFARLLAQLLLAEGDPAINDKQVRGTLVATVFRPHADVLRQDDVEDVVGDLWHKAKRPDGLYDLGAAGPHGILADLAFTYLEHMGGHYEVRAQHLENYCDLVRSIDPIFLIATRHVHHLCKEELDVATLDTGLERQSPLAMPLGDPDRPHADNHVHLYGIGITAHPLAGLLFYPDKSDPDIKIAFDPTLGIGSASDFRLQERLFCASARYILEYASMQLKPDLSELADEQRRGLWEGRRIIWPRLFEERLSNTSTLSIPQQLALGVARAARMDNAAKSLQTFAILALYLHTAIDQGEWRLHRSILAFIHSFHILRSCIIVSGAGLRTFVEYYRNPMRYRGRSFIAKDQWRALLGNGMDMIDAKIAPPHPKKIRQLSTQLSAHAKATAKEASGVGTFLNPTQHGWQRYHLSLHFIRSAISPKSSTTPHLAIRFGRERDRARDVAQKLRTALANVIWETADHPTGGPIRQNITSWIRSFDIAGDETCMPVEVFAPAFRWLRDKPIVQTIGGQTRVCAKRFFSIHAGEDFSHLVSGLRHMEETVEFCGLGTDDRIGHGLALGLDPEAGRNGRASRSSPCRRTWTTWSGFGITPPT